MISLFIAKLNQLILKISIWEICKLARQKIKILCVILLHNSSTLWREDKSALLIVRIFKNGY